MERGKDVFCSVETEEAVIGCMVMDDRGAEEAAAKLEGEDFSQRRYRLCFEILAQCKREGNLADALVLAERLQEAGMAKAEVIQMVSRISCSVGTTIHLGEYIKILKEKSYRWKLYEKGRALMEAAQREEVSKAAALAAEAGQVVQGGRKMTSMQVFMEQALLDVKQRMKEGRHFRGMRSGFLDLDLMLGGFQEEDLVVIAARPSMGKTAFLCNILYHGAATLYTQKKIAVFFSLEMPGNSLAERLMAGFLRIPGERFRDATLTVEDFKKLSEGAKEMEKRNGQIILSEEMALTVEGMEGICHDARSKTGQEIGLIAVDYLQLIQTPGKDRVNELAAVSRGLKRMARRFGCPVLALSQLNRSVENRMDKRPMLSDLRDSGAIEQDADVVLFLYREEYYYPDTEQKGTCEVQISKQRNGATGVVRLGFSAETAYFYNLERR